MEFWDSFPTPCSLTYFLAVTSVFSSGHLKSFSVELASLIAKMLFSQFSDGLCSSSHSWEKTWSPKTSPAQKDFELQGVCSLSWVLLPHGKDWGEHYLDPYTQSLRFHFLFLFLVPSSVSTYQNSLFDWGFFDNGDQQQLFSLIKTNLYYSQTYREGLICKSKRTVFEKYYESQIGTIFKLYWNSNWNYWKYVQVFRTMFEI